MVGPSEERVEILLVEDNPGDIRLTEEAIRASDGGACVEAVTRGSEALDYLKRGGHSTNSTHPDLILLDLSLPDVDGFEVLEEIRADRELRILPVIILTSSTDEEDVSEGYEKHANAYLTKPDDSDAFKDFGRRLLEFWNEFVKLPPTTHRRQG